MSSTATSPEPDAALSRSAELEAAKQRLEVDKLQHDLSFFGRLNSYVIPVVAILITITQCVIAIADWSAKSTREDRDLELKRIEMGVRLVEFASTEGRTLAGKDLNEGRKVVDLVRTLMPPEMACQMMNAFLLDARVVSDLTLYIATVRNKLAEPSSAPQACRINPRDQQDAAIIGTPKMADTPPKAVSPAPTLCDVSALDRKHLPLVVYYQIARKEDHDLAARLGYAVPDDFPSAGIEFVANQSLARVEVRYYHAEQAAEAAYLACLLKAGANDGGQDLKLEFRPPFLVKLGGNLPQHRIEVWFPPLSAKTATKP